MEIDLKSMTPGFTPAYMHSNFLPRIIPTCQPRKIVRWERHCRR